MILRRLLITLLCCLSGHTLYAAETSRLADNSLLSFFEQHDSIMLMIDPQDSRILKANNAAAQFYGYSQSALEKMSIKEINTLTPVQIEEEMQLALSEARNYFIFRHRLADGEIRTVESRTRLYAVEGKELLVSVIHDITPGRDLDQALWHYQDRLEARVQEQVELLDKERQTHQQRIYFALVLQAALILLLALISIRLFFLKRDKQRLLKQQTQTNRELQRLNEIMAHHFQEPSRRLVTYAQLLQRKGSFDYDPETRTALEFMQQQSSRLNLLVHDIQRFLALNAPPPQADWVSSQEVLDLCLARFEPQLKKCSAQIICGSPLPDVFFPRRFLSLIFEVLIENACRYSRPQVALKLEMSSRTEGGWVHFYLRDNGQGIEADFREKVFELFYSLSAKTEPDSSGIGLTLARKILALYGGWIQISDAKLPNEESGVCVEFAIKEPML